MPVDLYNPEKDKGRDSVLIFNTKIANLIEIPVNMELHILLKKVRAQTRGIIDTLIFRTPHGNLFKYAKDLIYNLVGLENKKKRRII